MNDLTQPTLLLSDRYKKYWQFGVLHCHSKQIEQGLNLYRFTKYIDVVMQIFLAALLRDDQTILIAN